MTKMWYAEYKYGPTLVVVDVQHETPKTFRGEITNRLLGSVYIGKRFTKDHNSILTDSAVEVLSWLIARHQQKITEAKKLLERKEEVLGTLQEMLKEALEVELEEEEQAKHTIYDQPQTDDESLKCWTPR